jgi:hypothetical protein
MPPEICPHCGALVPRKARACPECGSDEQTGWSERAAAQRLDLPDDEFDYDEFVREEFGGRDRGSRLRPRGIKWLWWVVAVLLLVMFFSWLLGLRLR